MTRSVLTSLSPDVPTPWGRLVIGLPLALATGIIGYRLTLDAGAVAAGLWGLNRPAIAEAVVRWTGVAFLAVCQAAAVAGPLRAIYRTPGTVERAIGIAAVAVGVLALFGAAVLLLSTM